MSLSRKVRKAIESGSASYGVVEANTNGFLTVKLIGSNQRITNLEYIGAYEPQEGTKVILDYSAGNKPVVRPVEQEYTGTAGKYTMKDKWTEPEVDPGILVGSVDVGMGCTVNAQGFTFPNEPHQPHQTWVQYWGYNTSSFINSIYDTMNMYGDPVVVGQQNFRIALNGKYLLSFHTSLHLAGASYSGDPHGTLTAFVYRTGGYGPFPVMVGRATAAGYNDYYNIDTSKVLYLSEGDQIYVELMYTGGVNSYALKNSTNPLKWITSKNDLIFKIQLLSETYVLEPPPELSVFDGYTRRVGYFGTQIEQGMDTATKDLTSFTVEVTALSEMPNGRESPISDDEYLYSITHDQNNYYSQYQLWKIDANTGSATFVEAGEGQIGETARNPVMVDDGIVGFHTSKKYSWSGSLDDTAITIKYKIMDWNQGSSENEIETIATFDVPWGPPIGTPDYQWALQTVSGSTIDAREFPTMFGQVATYGDKRYMIARATLSRRSASYTYYTRGMRWRFYDLSDNSYTDLDLAWTEDTAQVIYDSGWFQYNDKLYTFISRYGQLNASEQVAVHVVDLDQLSLTTYDISDDLRLGAYRITDTYFDYVRGRMYGYDGENLVYWDVEDKEIVEVQEHTDSIVLTGNKYGVYVDPLEGEIGADQIHEYYNAATPSIEIDAGDATYYTQVVNQASSDEDRIWILDLEPGDRKLVGYHRTLQKRVVSLENTAIEDLEGVYWAATVNLIGNIFIIAVYHDTQGVHWFIVKPRV